MLRRFLSTLAFAAAALTTGTALAAPHWGSFQADGCSRTGYRQYSAILWSIPFGQSWEAACQATPATINGYSFSAPSRCVNNFFNEWGQFDVIDRSCGVAPLAWTNFSSECRGDTVEVWSATLEGAPNDAEGQYLCETTPLYIWSETVYAESCELLPNGRWFARFPVPVDYCNAW